MAARWVGPGVAEPARAPAAVWVGCAGWSIPSAHATRFPAGGSHLARYSRAYPAVEINSSFYRAHQPATYARWAATVPAEFQFAVKVPRVITHERRLRDAGAPLDAFLAEVGNLGARLGPLLVQLPPSLPFDQQVADSFFAALRARHSGAVVCEPRHPSWFTPVGEALLTDYQIARVAADPAPAAGAAEPGGWPGLCYYRLHGSPQRYSSTYSAEMLDALARILTDHAAAGSQVWCIFDNTALGAATTNALDLLARLSTDGEQLGAATSGIGPALTPGDQ